MNCIVSFSCHPRVPYPPGVMALMTQSQVKNFALALTVCSQCGSILTPNNRHSECDHEAEMFERADVLGCRTGVTNDVDT